MIVSDVSRESVCAGWRLARIELGLVLLMWAGCPVFFPYLLSWPPLFMFDNIGYDSELKPVKCRMRGSIINSLSAASTRYNLKEF
jgi:hypothetical protein